MNLTDWKNRITTSPSVLVGKPTIRGLRISVEQILRAKGAGRTDDDLLREYPDLELDDIRACQAYAAELVGPLICRQVSLIEGSVAAR